MANPNPVPPYFLVVEESTCMNFSKSDPTFSGGMPMPVSFTETRIWAPFLSLRSHSTAIRTWPLAVNLMALPARFVTTCRIRPASPIKRRGMAGGYCTTKSMPFSSALEASISATSSVTRRRSNAEASIVSLPASILEKSRISLMTVSKMSPDWRAVSA